MAVTSDLSEWPLRSVSRDSSRRAGRWHGAAGFEVVVSREQDFALVRARGDLDMATSPRLALVLSSLLGDGCASVVLDLAELDWLDGRTAWLLGEAPRLFRDHGAELVVRSPRAEVRQVLDSAGLAWLVESHSAAADIAPLPC